MLSLNVVGATSGSHDNNRHGDNKLGCSMIMASYQTFSGQI